MVTEYCQFPLCSLNPRPAGDRRRTRRAGVFVCVFEQPPPRLTRFHGNVATCGKQPSKESKKNHYDLQNCFGDF